MSDAIAPEGWHTVTPRIVARDARQMVEFLSINYPLLTIPSVPLQSTLIPASLMNVP